MNSITDYIVGHWQLKLTCRNDACGRMVILTESDLRRLRDKNDDMGYWHPRLKCSKCGTGEPYRAMRETPLSRKPVIYETDPQGPCKASSS